MEKRSPHYRLPTVKALIEQGKVYATMTALNGAEAMGFGFDGMITVILSLTIADFYKSMTTYSDHKLWHDVYRPTTAAGEVYLKLTVIDGVLIVSFKEL